MSDLSAIVTQHALATGIPIDAPDLLGYSLWREFRHGPDSAWLEPFASFPGVQIGPLRPAELPDDVSLFGVPPPDFEPFHIRQMVSRGQLRSRITKPLTVDCIALELRQMAGFGIAGVSAGLEYLYEFAGIIPSESGPGEPGDTLTADAAALELDREIERLAKAFANMAKAHEWLDHIVRDLFQGLVCDTRAVISTIGFRDEYDIDELIGALARFHLVDSLLRSAEDAYLRIFETTGFDFLDFNDGKKTTKGCILKRMDAQLATLLRVLRLFARRRNISIDEWKGARIVDTDLEDMIGAFEIAFRKKYGERSEIEIGRIIRRLVPRITKMRRALATLKGDAGFRQAAAWQDRGPAPLEMLYLTCSFAVGWMQRYDAGTLAALPEDYEDGDDPVIRIDAVIRHAAQKQSIPPVRHLKEFAADVGRLYFTLRHIRVADPDSAVLRRWKDDGETISLIETFRTVYAERNAADPGQEPWRADVATQANKTYDRAIKGSDPVSRATVAETRGRISIRLSFWQSPGISEADPPNQG